MNSLEKGEYVKNLSLYMEKKKIYSLFENLYKSLILEKPENPVSFMIESLKTKASNFIRKTNIYNRTSRIEREGSGFEIRRPF